MNWISVKDKLPEEDGSCLIVIQPDIGKAWVKITDYCVDEKLAPYVTHWMPLPDPPEDRLPPTAEMIGVAERVDKLIKAEDEEIDNLLESIDARPACPTCGYYGA